MDCYSVKRNNTIIQVDLHTIKTTHCMISFTCQSGKEGTIGMEWGLGGFEGYDYRATGEITQEMDFSIS